MFCTKCGSHNLDDAEICRACSAPLVKRENRTSPLPQPRPTDQPPSSGSAPTLPYNVPPGPSGQTYGSPGSGQPLPQNYQPYQSSYANYTPPLPQSASGRALAAMILSIVALPTCGPFLSIPGLILGKLELDAINKGQASPAGLTFAKIGFYLGIGVTALYCVGFSLALFFGMLGGH